MSSDRNKLHGVIAENKMILFLLDLDRVLLNKKWLNNYLDVISFHLLIFSSDHASILLNITLVFKDDGFSSFRFEMRTNL